MKNQQIKQKMGEKNVKQWRIAEKIGVSEFTLCRWMRNDLDEEKTAMILEAIRELSEEGPECPKN